LANATLLVQTERVIAVSVETWATIGTLLAAIVGLYVALRSDIHRLETRIDRLDDRVYALAAGLKPRMDDVEQP
jgi:hypothetical protein